jgi:hypothetical protein
MAITIIDAITIENAQAAEFEENFLIVYPKPASFAGTNKQWLKKVVIDRLKSINDTGARSKIADPSLVIE